MPPLSVLVKPASGSCNLKCKYCFYQDVMENRNIPNMGMMKESTTINLIKKSFDYAENIITFAFQGGEPTLMGLDYFKKFVLLTKKYNSKGIMVNFAIQTNGILIDANWSEFFYENNFLVGLSLDGTKDINDLNRVDMKNMGSFTRVMKTVDILNKYRVSYNILTVVTKSVSNHISRVYSFFKENNFVYLQFIPCLDELSQNPGNNSYSLTPEQYGNFLCDLFDMWYKDFLEGKRLSIRSFDNILQMLLGYPPESCSMNGRCSVNPVIEADGSVYPCDFYVLDQWNLGNINKDDFNQIINSKTAEKFIEISNSLPSKCLKCHYLPICRGGCRRYKEPIINDSMKHNYFCAAYKKFYEYSLPRFENIVQYISHSFN